MKDKEKQFEKRIDCGVAYCVDTPVNPIEEMAKIIDDRLIEARGYLGSMNKGEGYWIAQKLIEHYQPKLPEDSVVLSREELEEKYEPSEKFMSVARELEELKQNLEDSVVITKREYDSLQCYKNKVERTCVFFTVQEWDEFCDGDGELPKTVLITAKEQAYEKGSKETAEKILNELYMHFSADKLCGIANPNKNYNSAKVVSRLAKQFGVEIKE